LLFRQTKNQKRETRLRTFLIWSVVLLLIASIAYLSPARDYQRAGSLLLRVENPNGAEWFAQLGTYAVEERAVSLPSPQGPIAARLYVPQARKSARGLVLLHGVHHLGIDEPRLVRFARAFAQSGVVVLTPELKALADYRIAPESMDVIGSSAHWLRQSTGKPVGVMGLSFAGGLALLAAADQRYAGDISFVVAVGAHDDLSRVARFLVTDRVEAPGGSIAKLPAEQYGALVLVYSHARPFFSAADSAAARDSIRLWLWEQYAAAHLRERDLSARGQTTLEALFRHQMENLRSQLLAEIERDRAEFDQVSPHGHLAALHVPVFLLHGAGDAVIPSSETLWLAREIPANDLEAVLVSPAISHVDTNSSQGRRAQWQLVSFMAHVFHELEQPGPGSLGKLRW